MSKKQIKNIFCVSAVLVVLVLVIKILVPMWFTRIGDNYMNSGEYEMAIDVYKKSNSPEKLRDSILKYAEIKAKDRNYDDVIYWLKQLDREDFNNAVLKYAKLESENGNYSKASDLLQELEPAYREELFAEVLKNAEIETESGNYGKAFELLRQLGSEGFEKISVLITQMTQSKDHEAPLTSQDYETARERGMMFNDIDTQLMYCRALYNASYDIREVYPDGVSVNFTGHERYSITSFINNNESSNNNNNKLDTSGIIVLRREQLRSGEDISSYSVKLLPAAMFGLYPNVSRCAKSLDEATCIIIVDGVYIHEGNFTEYKYRKPLAEKYNTDINKYSKRFSDVNTLPYYAAVNNITAYDAKNPSRGNVLSGNIHHAPCAGYPEQLDRFLSVDERFGEFDYDEMINMQNLDSRVAMFIVLNDIL